MFININLTDFDNIDIILAVETHRYAVCGSLYSGRHPLRSLCRKWCTVKKTVALNLSRHHGQGSEGRVYCSCGGKYFSEGG